MNDEETYCTCVSAPPGGGHSPKCGYTLIKQFEKDTRELVFDCRDMRIERDSIATKLKRMEEIAAAYIKKFGSQILSCEEYDRGVLCRVTAEFVSGGDVSIDVEKSY